MSFIVPPLVLSVDGSLRMIIVIIWVNILKIPHNAKLWLIVEKPTKLISLHWLWQKPEVACNSNIDISSRSKRTSEPTNKAVVNLDKYVFFVYNFALKCPVLHNPLCFMPKPVIQQVPITTTVKYDSVTLQWRNSHQTFLNHPVYTWSISFRTFMWTLFSTIVDGSFKISSHLQSKNSSSETHLQSKNSILFWCSKDGSFDGWFLRFHII